ncbi:hypothetical protein E05_15610 [Plautia stali symbiont]|nr:hypothetical protein E05_15610 [Plautia stali symbiont]
MTPERVLDSGQAIFYLRKESRFYGKYIGNEDATRSWSGLRKNLIAKVALSFSDLIALNLALFLSAATVQGIWENWTVLFRRSKLNTALSHS